MRATLISTRSHTAVVKGVRVAALLLASLMLALIVATGAYAQAEPGEESADVSRRETETAKSVVTGKAVYDDNGRPVRRASIMLIDLGNTQEFPDKFSTATDVNGKFKIKNVPAGNYLVMVDAPGVLTPLAFINLDENRAPTPADFVEARKHFDEVVVDGTNEVKVEVRARRGGAISGKITYKDGDPAINVLISIVRKREESGGARFISGFNPSSLMGMHTDDRGMYRVAGLPPGEYLVSAAEPNTRVDDASGQVQTGGMDRFMREVFTSDALAVTYYGDARTARDATTIKVEPGDERSDINITLIEHQNFLVGGTLTSKRDHRPLNRATLKLRSKEDYGGFFPTERTTQTDEQGNWLFGAVPDGTYIITVEPPYEPATTTTATTANSDEPQPVQPAPRTRPRLLSRKQQEVSVNGSDITALAIELSEGASISGTVAFEDSRKPPAYTSIGIERIDGVKAGETGYASVDADTGSFSFEGLAAGEIFLTATLYQNNNYYIKSVTLNGRDLLREPLKLGESDQIRGVQIVMSSNTATLVGRVLENAGGKPRGGVLVGLVPNAAQRWRARSGRLYARTNDAGEFKLSGPPGEYLVFVWPSDKASETLNESYLRTHAADAQRVTMQPGGRHTVDFLLPGQQN
jgi:hypothetical protein